MGEVGEATGLLNVCFVVSKMQDLEELRAQHPKN